jgi:hypothetical protein
MMATLTGVIKVSILTRIFQESLKCTIFKDFHVILIFNYR